MKLQFPELKFPNTLLTIWWGAAMMAGLLAFFLRFNNYYPYTDVQLPPKHLIMLVILSYFIVVQIFTLKYAIQEKMGVGSLIEKWRAVMAQTHILHLLSILPLLLLPFTFDQYNLGAIVDNNWIELIIAPSTYSQAALRPYTFVGWIGYIAFGTAIAYLHIRVLAAWVSLGGLAFRPVDIAKILVIILGIVVLLDYSTSTFIEPVIIEGWGRSCEGRGVGSPNFTETCQPFWIYRNINRIVESLEYSLYGTFTGGIQFINIFKAPLIGYWYDGVTSINLGELKQIRINLELVRNLIMGILSPSIQLFFIMRYLKKRSFEKAKREYAA